jgi:Skp family chaperone for outer membrane proteins
VRRRLAAAATLAALALSAVPATAQVARPPFLYLNQERVLTGSERGRALLAEEEAARDGLRAEARRIESAFEAEEKQLTDQRATLDPAEFRARSNDFDARVVKARADQDARAAALAQEFDQTRRKFYADVAPILVGVMEQAGALAIFDETTVLIADQSLNVTDEVIAAIDRAPVPAPQAAPSAPASPAPETGIPETPAPPPANPANAEVVPDAPEPADRIPAPEPDAAGSAGPRKRPGSE